MVIKVEGVRPYPYKVVPRKPISLAVLLALPGLLATPVAANATVVDQPAVYDPIANKFSLPACDHPTWTTFGAGPGWLPIAGDWNGDHEGGVGLYNAAKQQFLIKNQRIDGAWDAFFKFQGINKKFQPIAGDWNANGEDTIGVYNPKTGEFRLKNNNKKARVDRRLKITDASRTWTPVSGKWGVNGADSIGLYDPASQTFYLKFALTKGRADVKFHIDVPGAQPNWLPVTGDWDGNGIGGLGIYDPQTGRFFLINDYTKTGDENPDRVVSAPLAHSGLIPLSVKMSVAPAVVAASVSSTPIVVNPAPARVVIGPAPSPVVLTKILQPVVNQTLYPTLDAGLTHTVEPVLLNLMQPVTVTLGGALTPISQVLNVTTESLVAPVIHNITGSVISPILSNVADNVVNNVVEGLTGQLSQVLAVNPLLANLTETELTQLLTNVVQQVLAQNPSAILGALDLNSILGTLDVNAILGQLLPNLGVLNLDPIVHDLTTLNVGAVLNDVPLLGTVLHDILDTVVGLLNGLLGSNLNLNQPLLNILSGLTPDQILHLQALGAVDDVLNALLGPALSGPVGILTQCGLISSTGEITTAVTGQVTTAVTGIVSGILGNVLGILSSLTSEQINALIATVGPVTSTVTGVAGSALGAVSTVTDLPGSTLGTLGTGTGLTSSTIGTVGTVTGLTGSMLGGVLGGLGL